MTLPVERRRAIENAGEFLLTLLDPKKTPRIPRSVRRDAGMVLRHYPLFNTFETYYKERT